MLSLSTCWSILCLRRLSCPCPALELELELEEGAGAISLELDEGGAGAGPNVVEVVQVLVVGVLLLDISGVIAPGVVGLARPLL